MAIQISCQKDLFYSVIFNIKINLSNISKYYPSHVAKLFLHFIIEANYENFKIIFFLYILKSSSFSSE